jgi:drug/metabolite transporter (DMT)-like permease
LGLIIGLIPFSGLGALLARFYLREDVGTARWMGTLVITAGVAIVAFGEASAEH